MAGTDASVEVVSDEDDFLDLFADEDEGQQRWSEGNIALVLGDGDERLGIIGTPDEVEAWARRVMTSVYALAAQTDRGDRDGI